MDRLIPMTDYVLSLTSEHNYKEIARLSVKYAQFLKQPLELGMFVPCDEKGNVLNEPNEDDSKYYPTANNGYFYRVMFNDDVELYEEAREKVLFEGFKFVNALHSQYYQVYRFIVDDEIINISADNSTIEDILKDFPDGFTFSESAKKKIGL